MLEAWRGKDNTVLVCGLKLTHDGGVAVIDGNDLLFSVELEKLDENPRYQPLDRLELVTEILAGQGIKLDDIDRFVVDGWFSTAEQERPTLPVSHAGRSVGVPVAPYSELEASWGGRPEAIDPLHRYWFTGLPLDDVPVDYTSYHHATQHVLGAYCTSPFARAEQPALVLVWDGGMVPRLYEVDGKPLRVRPLGPLIRLYGSAFADYAATFEPFRASVEEPDGRLRPVVDGHLVPKNLDVAGKAMAFAALGRDEPDFYRVFDAELRRLPLTFDTATLLGREIGARRAELWPGCSDADLIASFQGYLGTRLLAALRNRVTTLSRTDPATSRLCLAGGCALNIKWNSAIRASGMFDEVWVPPFANDSGAALGTALTDRVRDGVTELNWSVYSGPDIVPTDHLPGWDTQPCDAGGLGRLLYESGEPVVVLRGRAELGPRALGHRSILAPATDPKMKDVLNDIKDRDFYRPVAPVCLEDRAPDLFQPGCPDPYMLFDHRVRDDWANRIPAVVHLDGTARLQTVDPAENRFLAAVLTAYERLSGVPVLCNTSANQRGRGFFPSVEAAARWGRVRHIWCHDRLHTRWS